MASTVALIPARAGSKGVPHKNIRPLGGHALMEWTIAACRRAMLIDRVIVSTDSEEYAALARGFGAEAPFLRPAEISGDRATDYDFIVHALDFLRAEGAEPSYVAHMRPTTPFRDPSLVDAAIRAFRDSTVATALRSVHEMPESAYKCFEVTSGGQLKRLGAESTELDAANNARQAFPPTYSANGYVDVLSTAFIRRSGLIHGGHVLPFVTSSVTEVDVESDFAHLEFQLVRSPEIISKIF